MTKDLIPPPEFTEFLLYTTLGGEVKVEIFFQNDTVWLSQKRMSELFGVERPAVTKHLGNIFESGELDENSVSSILEHTADDGKISCKQADTEAYAQYDTFNKTQQIESDFDRVMKNLEKKESGEKVPQKN